MSQPDYGHHRLRNRYRFTGSLFLETALRVSSGRASDDTDAPIMRRLDGVPYIPGSSLRGALRSELERILAAVDQEAVGLTGCISFTEDCCAENLKVLKRQNDAKNPAQGKKDTTILVQEFVAQDLCDLCCLFGFPDFASRLVIEDALPKDLADLPGHIRDGVGIDRDTGAARETVKFNYEVMEPGHRFTFTMVVENVCRDADRRLITLILNLLKQGLNVGGKRAAGLGRIRLESWQVDGFTTADQLWDRLLAGQNIHASLTWPEGPPC